MPMTEAEWLACADPTPMLKCLRGKASARKRRLFAVACCKRFWQRLPDGPSRQAVVVAERFADGQATSQELELAAAHAHRLIRTEGQTVLRAGRQTVTVEGRYSHAAYAAYVVASPEASYAARQVAISNPAIDDDSSVAQEEASVAGAKDKGIRCDLLREIFDNPFHPSPALPTVVLAWNDRTIVRLAQAIYEERQLPAGTLDTGRLAILADALLDAGCDDEDLIAHCRSAGPHVRGCWAVDLILGKS
jgi:hypothetical protein